MLSLREMVRNMHVATENSDADKQAYNPLVCQCCGYERKHDEAPECLCDGLDWYLDKDGRIECQAHRFARAIGQPKRQFVIFGKKK